MSCDIHSFPCNKERMEYLSTIVWTVLFTILFVVLYKVLINPQIVISPDTTKMAPCPDGWNMVNNLCTPNYKTTCQPFDPKQSTIQSASAKCNLARTCGTTWSGMCG